MSHFIAKCTNYPVLTFNVPGLRPIFDKSNRAKQSTWKHFVGGVYDSKVDDLQTDGELAAVRDALSKLGRHGARVEIIDVPDVASNTKRS